MIQHRPVSPFSSLMVILRTLPRSIPGQGVHVTSKSLPRTGCLGSETERAPELLPEGFSLSGIYISNTAKWKDHPIKGQ